MLASTAIEEKQGNGERKKDGAQGKMGEEVQNDNKLPKAYLER